MPQPAEHPPLTPAEEMVLCNFQLELTVATMGMGLPVQPPGIVQLGGSMGRQLFELHRATIADLNAPPAQPDIPPEVREAMGRAESDIAGRVGPPDTEPLVDQP